jgi:hypothetical protein
MTTELLDDRDPFTILSRFTVDRFKNEEDWEDQEERLLVGAVEERYEQAKTAKENRAQLIEYNYLLLKGETRIGRTRVDNETLRIVTDADPRQTRSTDNIVLPMHRAFVGKFTRAVPMTRARARSSDKDDMLAAELIDSYLDYFRLGQKMRLKYKRWVEAISPTGTGILHLFWNRDAGPVVAICEQCDFASRDETPGTPCPACAEQIALQQQQQQMELQQFDMEMGAVPQAMPMSQEPLQEPPLLQEAREGDLQAKTIQWRDYFPDPGARADPETVKWAITTDAIHVSDARKMFPERAHLIDEEEGLYADRYIFAPTGLADARIETRELKSHVQLKTYYEGPSGLHPDGRVIYIANGRLLVVHPYIEARLLGRLPFYYARGDVDEDNLWGLDIISQCEPQQRERDILVTQLRRWRELTLNPRVLKTTMAGLHSKRLSTVPGEIITAGKIDENNIRFMRPPQIPAYVPGELERLETAAQKKFGVTTHELGMGDPGQSGRYAAFLETQASETIGPLVIEVNEEFLEFNRGVIVLARHYIAPDRIWTTTSRGRIFTRSWGEANVLPGWDVYMVNVDAVSRNPVIREQNARDRLQIGYYTDQATGRIEWDRYRLDAGLDQDIAGSDSEASQHIKAAELPKMIEEALMNGQPPPLPMPWDNAYIIASGLVDWLRGPGEMAPEPIRRAVAFIWFQYAQSLVPDPTMPVDPEVAKVLPNQMFAANMQQQQPGMGPGGSQPGQQTGGSKPGAGTPTAAHETAQKVTQADRAAEQASRGQQRHEG